MSRLAEATLREFFGEADAEFRETVVATGSRRSELVFAGQTLALRCAGEELAERLLRAFGPRLVPADDRPPSTDRAAVAIDLWDERAVSGEPRTLPWREHDLGPRGLVRGHPEEGVSAVHEAGSGAVTLVDRDARRVLYRVPDAHALPWWERAAPLRPALFWTLTGPRRGLVHAGAVGDWRGGVLLAGAGGSGKTTVALAALGAGMSYVADDYLLLDLASDPVAWNLFGTAKLDEGHLARFPALAELADEPSVCPEPDQKTVLDVARRRPQSLARSLPLRAVVVPSIRGGHARLRPISAAEALLALAPSTVFQMPFDDGAVVGLLSDVVRRLPCFALDVGDHPGELAQALERVLDHAPTDRDHHGGGL